MEQQVKTVDRTIRYRHQIVVTGQEDVKDEEQECQDVEED